jgi:hypothetical protein
MKAEFRVGQVHDIFDGGGRLVDPYQRLKFVGQIPRHGGGDEFEHVLKHNAPCLWSNSTAD